MNKTYSILTAAALTIAAVPAFAAPERGKPAPAVAAILKASPTLQRSPGLAAIVSAKAAAEGVTTTPKSTEKFGGTFASMHGEDQCTLLNVSINQYSPPSGSPTTYLTYDTRNICDPAFNGSASFEVPDSVFGGDPRTGSTVTLNVDLSGAQDSIYGPPMILAITFTKTNTLINRSNYRTVSEANSAGVRKVLTYNTVSTNTTAVVSGTLSQVGGNALPLGDATISWDDTTNTTSVQ